MIWAGKGPCSFLCYQAHPFLPAPSVPALAVPLSAPTCLSLPYIYALQMYIVPDPDKLTKQKTRVSKDRAPKFDESFSW